MTLWFITRGAGLSALILLTVATCLGALVSRPRGSIASTGVTAPTGAGPAARTAERRYVAQYVHRAVAGLGVVVLLLHIFTAVADAYAHVGLIGAVVPFTSGYRPTWIALGTLATYCLLAVSVLGLARGRMAASQLGARLWRGLHGLAYLGWATAMLHGFTSGTDSTAGWVRALYLACMTAVAACVWIRFADHPEGRPTPVVPLAATPAEVSR